MSQKKPTRHLVVTRALPSEVKKFERAAIKEGFVKTTGKPNISKWVLSKLNEAAK